MELSELLRQESDELIAQAWTEVQRARLEHYRSEDATRERLATLLELTIECVDTGRGDLVVEHINRIARERWVAGFDLFEVQTAINILEEAVWKRLLGEMESEEALHALGLISTILGMAKDTLARTYLVLASNTPPVSFSSGEP